MKRPNIDDYLVVCSHTDTRCKANAWGKYSKDLEAYVDYLESIVYPSGEDDYNKLEIKKWTKKLLNPPKLGDNIDNQISNESLQDLKKYYKNNL